MSANNLLRQPIWQADDLGRPIPDSPHAISVALPRWQDVVGYEEKKPEVVSRLACGYPRFVIHPLVQQIASELGGSQPCLPFPSARTAAQCAAFIRQSAQAPASIKTLRGLHGVITTDAGSAALKAFWQHTGLIISTRQATAWLADKPTDGDAAAAVSLRRLLAGFYDCAVSDVFLTPTGMTAQFEALQAVLARAPGRPTAQLGFPYVDTLKLQQKFGVGAHLLHDLARIETDLHELIHREPLAACFGEIPGNPLLGSANLARITPLLREHGVPFVADDVVATPFNVDLGGHADLIATSLTKYIVGTGDVMGGAVICNPRSPYHADLKFRVAERHEDLLWPEDARVLASQAASFPERMKIHNANGLWIAEQLKQHPAIERVWYPKWEFNEVYDAVRRPGGGYGSLITFLPRHAERTSPRIYDALRVSKGPSLGTVFTLACPFTLLAHYTELEWAESCGVSRYLIRISVGLEEPQELWNRLAAALNGMHS